MANLDAKVLKRKKRGHNFSAREEDVLMNEYRGFKERFDNIQGAKISVAEKSKMWLRIAEVVSRVGVAHRSDHDVKQKWTNMQREAKAANSEYKKSIRATGGGSPAVEPTAAQQDIIQMFQDDDAFHGIQGGIETTIEGYNAVPMHQPVQPYDHYDVNSTESLGFDTINASDLDGVNDVYEDMNNGRDQVQINASDLDGVNDVYEDMNNGRDQVQASSDHPDVQPKLNPATASLDRCKKPRTKPAKVNQEDVWRSQINWCEEQRATGELERTKLKLQIEVLALIKEKLQENKNLDKIPTLERVAHTVTSNSLEE